MKLSDFLTLPEDDCNRVKDLLDPCVYRVQADIIYEGHIPHVAFLVTAGEIRIGKKKKELARVKEGALIGVREMMNSMPIQYSVSIDPGTQVCIIDKSTIKEFLSSGDPGLAQIFLRMIA